MGEVEVRGIRKLKGGSALPSNVRLMMVRRCGEQVAVPQDPFQTSGYPLNYALFDPTDSSAINISSFVTDVPPT